MVGGCERSHGMPGCQVEGRSRGEGVRVDGGSTLAVRLGLAEDGGVVEGNSCSSVVGSLAVIMTIFNVECPLGKISCVWIRQTAYNSDSPLSDGTRRPPSVSGRVFQT